VRDLPEIRGVAWAGQSQIRRMAPLKCSGLRGGGGSSFAFVIISMNFAVALLNKRPDPVGSVWEGLEGARAAFRA
jgi:hypothetical protein